MDAQRAEVCEPTKRIGSDSEATEGKGVVARHDCSEIGIRDEFVFDELCCEKFCDSEDFVSGDT